MTAQKNNPPPLTLAIPKGRLQDRTEELLRSRGYEIRFENRKLVAEDPNGRLRVMLVKNSDLPTYVHHGIAGLGVCGTDVIHESGYQFFRLMELPFGNTRMCLAARTNHQPDRDTGRLRVASKFTRFSRDYFQERGIPCEIIRLDGSVELAPVLGLAPYIVDLVETGSTLRANDLAVVEELATISVVLVANPAFYKFHCKAIDTLVDTLR
jgi:ATP phosphoribosyltransferase